MPPFHHGSHYNTMGFVLWYLIRLEPFTSLHVWLQDGKFDKADRLFDSVEKVYLQIYLLIMTLRYLTCVFNDLLNFLLLQTWESCISNPSDVKELIPEWFTSPEMFTNTNKLDLGFAQVITFDDECVVFFSISLLMCTWFVDDL